MSTMAVVVGYDASETGRKALEWAVREAVRRGAPLRILYAYGIPLAADPVALPYPTDSEDIARAVARDLLTAGVALAKAIAPELDIDTVLETLPAAAALVDQGRSADVLVVGARGMDAFGALVLGSTAMQVATHASCPTVVVPSDGRGRSWGPEAGRVVVGVDSSPSSDPAIAFAFEEAGLLGVGLTAVHAWEAPFFDTPGGKGGAVPRHVLQDDLAAVVVQERDSLDVSLTGWQGKYPDVDVRHVIVHQKAAAALVGASAGAELLVVGSRGRGGFASLLLGSVSYRVLRHAHCPTAVVRPSRG